MRASGWLAAAAVVGLAAACGAGAQEDERFLDPSDGDWDDIVEAAEGQTLRLHMWGGSNEINAFVDDVYGEALAERRGIELERVPVGDTADAVTTVLGELEAGVAPGDGDVDLIWINGENFRTLRQADGLLEDWARDLPNAELVDWDDPAVAYDAGIPVDGDESPWGSAQFQLVHDAERTDAAELPRSFEELLAWAAEEPGRLTYPEPPAFHGTRFLKMAFYEVTGGHEQWLGAFDEEAEAAYAEARHDWLDYLEALDPLLWREGETYPTEIADLDRLFADGEVDLTFTQLPAGIQPNIDAGVLPASARPFVLDTGTVGDFHYLAIPRTASHPEAAMVFADLVLEPDLQAAKLDPAMGWADGLAVDVGRLASEQQAEVDAILDGLGEAALPAEELEAARLPAPEAPLKERLEEDWDRVIRQGRPR